MADRSQSTSLSWQTHLRICWSSVLSHRIYLIYTLLFPVLIIGLGGGNSGFWYRLSAIVLLALLPTGLVTAAALTGEQLRAFGFVIADQRRHRITMILVTLTFCVLAFALYAVVNALSGGLPWWCLGVAALVSIIFLAVRAIPSGASGDDPALRPERPAHTQVNIHAVRRTWRPAVQSIAALVIGQMLVRMVFPDAAQTAMTVLMVIVGITAVIAGSEQADLLRTRLVFGGSRRAWARTVLREGTVLPVAGALGAVVAMVLEKVFVDGLGWADTSALVTVGSMADAGVIAIAGAATGVVVLLVGMASTVADVQLPGSASIPLVMVVAATWWAC